MRPSRKTNCRKINGVLLLDKPLGMTSNEVLQRVKRLYVACKAGHTGSLDPLASGMLPLCFGEATKFAQFLLNTDKSYIVRAKLGVKTATGDTEGEVLEEKPVPKFTLDQIQAVLKKFQGDIEQLPSMYSALKHNGQPLYKLARAGISVEREKRVVTVYRLDLLGSNPTEHPTELDLFVHCSKGTYVRTLVEDIGDALGVGAHVTMLRRKNVGNYKEDRMVTLQTLEELASQGDFAKLDALLLPIESMIESWPVLTVTEDLVYYLRQGNPVLIPRSPTSGYVQLRRKDGNFVGVGEVLPDGKIAPRKIVF
ncbi:MAG: tRNA pseudouridine(55) synthase TruB [Gammaproteobacteria bacterium]